MNRLLALLLVLASGLTACGGSGFEVDVRAVASQAGVDAADVPARDAVLEDEQVTWPQVAAWIAREADAGRPVVVNLYGSWCEPCRAEAPLLRDAIAAHPDIAFLLVDTRDGIIPGRQFLVDEGLAGVPAVFDPGNLVYEGLGARGMPTTAFFAADGSAVGIVHGILTEPVLAQRLADLEATIDRG